MITLATGESVRGVADVASKVTYTFFGDEISSGPTDAFKTIAQGQLPNAAAALYTVGAGNSAILRSIVLVNTDSSAHTAQLFVNGSAASNAITPVFTIPANGWAVWDGEGWQVYDSSGTVQTSGGQAAHSVVGALHTATGLTSGHVLHATGVSTFAFGQAQHGDLGGVGANDHHNQSHVHLGDGSGTVAHSSLSGIGANDHHNQAHVLSGADHTASGLTAGQVIRATGAATFAWAQLGHPDLDSVGANDHHNQAHVLAGADHTASGLTTGQVMRATGAATFAWGTVLHSEIGSVGANDHHNQAHGASDHTDITRSLFLQAGAISGVDGTAAASTVGGVPDILSTRTISHGSTNGMYWSVGMPADCKAGSTLSIRISWFPTATDATPHTIRWSVDALAVVAGTLGSTAGTTTAFTGSSAARTVNVMVEEPATQILASVNPGDIIRIDLRRIGADAADTYLSDIKVWDIWLDYTAVQ